MTVKENVSVYCCGFCKKKLFVKGAMERHEKHCTHNPANHKKCLEGCTHLGESMVEIGNSEDYGGGIRSAKCFYCKAQNKFIYPPVVERKGLNIKYPETFKNQEPMPNECEYFESLF